ncbi:hypothetical protein ARAF_1985 [Arsenophonus endosymbiont of Aleurodicus floccissimus]|uniref:hypothetical protein n=1 Tax=Arsenophonus endosymbiont of Aleurodicus floccissimus TaxID=2152761 RepID=UPI000ED89A4F|nr:hypothetical protein [Arsenophonus endosymbiont of Aleurodicus floccissimus]SPP32092.1 hypothetical protein ARAF_1985 [Arsenophonus endosymbiont of Aleurodicus floccissimus]
MRANLTGCHTHFMIIYLFHSHGEVFDFDNVSWSISVEYGAIEELRLFRQLTA